MKLKVTFDLAVNGFSQEGFCDNPAAAMCLMFSRASEFLDGQNLIDHENPDGSRTVYTVMGHPVAHLVEDVDDD